MAFREVKSYCKMFTEASVSPSHAICTQTDASACRSPAATSHPKPLPPYPLLSTKNPTHQIPHPSWMAGNLMRRIVNSVNLSLTWLAQGTSVLSSQVIRLAARLYKRPGSQALRKHRPDARRSESLPPLELAVTDPNPGISW